ncbi:MAG: hypothetical protein L0J45_09700, partial [Psychroflexus sp.]|nr:hypothetical protein [Psychroflexus sp.]
SFESLLSFSCIYHSYAFYTFHPQAPKAIHLHYFTHAIPTAPAATFAPKPIKICYASTKVGCNRCFIMCEPAITTGFVFVTLIGTAIFA